MKKLLVHDVLGLRSEGKLGLSASPWTSVKSCIQYFGRQIDLNIRALYTLLGWLLLNGGYRFATSSDSLNSHSNLRR